jgi:hypothetical protein
MPLSCNDYYCPENQSCIKLPLQATGLAPFVRMSFPALDTGDGSGNTKFNPKANDLTVGNKSNLPNNHAVIKSFTYGSSDGNGAEVEIYDEEGGEFDLLVQKMVKVLSEGNEFGCAVEWGWTVTDCDDIGINFPGNKRHSTIKSSQHYFLIISVDIHFANSGIVFKLELLDTMMPMFETRIKDTIEGVNLKEAIRGVFNNQDNPIQMEVVFAKLQPTSSGEVPCNTLVSEGGFGNQSFTLPPDVEEFEFESPWEDDPPEEDWQTANLNPLGAVREWLKDKKTTDKKGTIIFYNSTSPNKQLVILEDPLPRCEEEVLELDCSRSIGTYIVNGGAKSPVISFDPQIKFNWAAAAKAGGGTDPNSAAGGNAGSEDDDDDDDDDNDNDDDPCVIRQPSGTGTQTHVTLGSEWASVAGPEGYRDAIEGLEAQSKANKNYEAVEAELRIQGDPTLDNPFAIKIKTVSILVINPFHLRNKTNRISGCPEWLVAPPCNRILSNKNWFIKGVSHEIKEGAFTTTLKLFLPAPGKIIPT